MTLKSTVSTLLVFLFFATNYVESQLTVSGVSSGGYMAVQFQVAYSKSVSGAGIIAGGPYWCAQSNVAVALSACMEYPSLIIVEELITATYDAEANLSIDSPSHLKNHRVWLQSGTKDTVVYQGVMKKLMDYYLNWLSPSQIKANFDLPAEHSFPTLNYGNPCDYLGKDYINNCKFDAAGDLLNWLYSSKLSPPATTWSTKNIIRIDQSKFIKIPGVSIGMASVGPSAFAYIPSKCQSTGQNCSIHVAFHGCEQYISKIGDKFYTKTGYNAWAESNNIIVLYPQADYNLLNPKGCWDWWGYTGLDYSTQWGVQMGMVKGMVDSLAKKYKISY